MNSIPPSPVRLPVTCRPAKVQDKVQVLEFIRLIWGDDYIAQTWDEWLEDTTGLLAVAENQDQVVGCGKLTRLSDRDWWMEGLRIHPHFAGQKIGSQLHRYLLDTWRSTGRGILRLATASNRIPVHRICASTGFEKVAEFQPHRAPAIAPDPPGDVQEFHLVSPGEISEAMRFIPSSPLFQASGKLVDRSWQWSGLHEDYLSASVQLRRAWWWQGRKGLLAWTDEDEEEDEQDPQYGRTARLQILACSMEELSGCLTSVRKLGGQLGYQTLAWQAPVHPIVTESLADTGFHITWELTLLVFALQHSIQ